MSTTQPNTPGNPTVPLNSTPGRWLMTAVILPSAMAFIDATALNVVLPSLQKNLNATGADLFWILNAYLLVLAALILVGGSLGDLLGRKKIFMTGIFIFILSSAACGLAPSVTYLIVFRIIQGVGGALMIPGSLSLLSSLINENERGKAIGTWSAITTVVTIGGPVIGGALADAGLWRYIFFINIPIGLIALIILLRKVNESRSDSTGRNIDFPGAITIALGLAALTFGFLRIPALGFNHWQIYLTLSLGIILLIAFIILEKKSPHPMMPLHLFSNPSFSGANLLTFFLYAGLGAGMLFLSLDMVQAQGYSQLQSGLTFLPFTLMMIFIARPAGSLADKFGSRLLLTIGPATAGLGLLLLSFVGSTNGAHDYWTTFFPGILLFGLGMSFTVAPLTTTVMRSVSDQFSGTASGVNNAVSRVGGVFANAIFGALAVLIFSSNLQKSLPANIESRPALLQQAANLGNAAPPSSLSPQIQALAKQSYHTAFISTCQTLLLIAAILAFLGAAMAILFIHKPAPQPTKSS
ncbi:MAG: MFS transporter [Bacteroidetes bacterium]|nr:MFS transporter [Bacteroidota bacterium]